MNKILIALLLVMFLATPAFAGYYHYLQIEASGEYRVNTTFSAPEVNWVLSAEGLGDLKINSIIAVNNFDTNWWNLF